MDTSKLRGTQGGPSCERSELFIAKSELKIRKNYELQELLVTRTMSYKNYELQEL